MLEIEYSLLGELENREGYFLYLFFLWFLEALRPISWFCFFYWDFYWRMQFLHDWTSVKKGVNMILFFFLKHVLMRCVLCSQSRFFCCIVAFPVWLYEQAFKKLGNWLGPKTSMHSLSGFFLDLLLLRILFIFGCSMLLALLVVLLKKDGACSTQMWKHNYSSN